MPHKVQVSAASMIQKHGLLMGTALEPFGLGRGVLRLTFNVSPLPHSSMPSPMHSRFVWHLESDMNLMLRFLELPSLEGLLGFVFALSGLYCNTDARR
jgi:hypothetical protein